MLPIACQSLLTLNMNNAAIYNLRRTNDFTIPSFRTNLRKKCIKISGPKFWDSIPLNLTLITSLNIFKNKLRTHFIDNYIKV